MTNHQPALTLPAEEMRALGYRIIDMIVARHTQLRDLPAARKTDPATLFENLRQPFPEQGVAPAAAIEILERHVFSSLARIDHPRFFAFVPGPGNFVGAMADALAAGFNVFEGTWLGGSGPSALELVTLDWLRDELGLPATAEGLFVSGGSVANLTGLVVARRSMLADRLEGAVVYLSDQTHSAAERALRILGLQPAQIRTLPSDETFRLPLDALRAAVACDRAAGRVPFCVVASAGTTGTGAVDPLVLLADFCQEQQLWLHVDGAYGAAAALCARGRDALAGLDRADSLALDPHKWMFQPIEMGCVFVRDGAKLQETFSIHPEILRDVHRGVEEVHFCDRGIQLTRGFRALKLWLSLQVFGVDAFRRAIERGFELAELAEWCLRASGAWEIVTPAQMGIVSFRYALDERVNDLLVEAALADGFAFFTSTTLRGRTVLRLCTINPRTTEDDIRETVVRMEALARGLKSLR